MVRVYTTEYILSLHSVPDSSLANCQLTPCTAVYYYWFLSPHRIHQETVTVTVSTMTNNLNQANQNSAEGDVIPWKDLIKMDVSPVSRLFWFSYTVNFYYFFSFSYSNKQSGIKWFCWRVINLFILYWRQMATTTLPSGEPAPEDTSLYPIAVLIDELKNEDVQVKL